MKRFTQVKQILDNAVGGQNFGAHGAFWRTLSRDQFVAKSVFGQKLLVVGDAASSNIVHALKGEKPFGTDLGTPGAMFRRMPAGRPPVAPQDIDFISAWINDGCPDDQPDDAVFDSTAGGPVDPAVHNAYWREFDNWSMFQATPEVTAAIDAFFGSAPLWMSFAKDAKHYGEPIPLLTVLDSFEAFGSASLPPDPERPQDPNHNMNGAGMWFFWSAFTDACLRISEGADFWEGFSRAILVGLLNDGLFRGRFSVNGFSANGDAKQAIRDFARSIDAASLQAELARRFVDSRLG